MQLRTIWILSFLGIVSLGCIESAAYSKKEFWQSVFVHLKTEYFSNTIQQKTICTEAIINLNSVDTNDYIDSNLKEIEDFFGTSYKGVIRKESISEKELQLQSFPISFEKFDNLSKQELHFTKKGKCGVLINSPVFFKNKAVLSIGIIYNPKAVTDYLLFLEYVASKKKWKVVKTKVLGFS